MGLAPAKPGSASKVAWCACASNKLDAGRVPGGLAANTCRQLQQRWLTTGRIGRHTTVNLINDSCCSKPRVININRPSSIPTVFSARAAGTNTVGCLGKTAAMQKERTTKKLQNINMRSRGLLRPCRPSSVMTCCRGGWPVHPNDTHVRNSTAWPGKSETLATPLMREECTRRGKTTPCVTCRYLPGEK